MAEHNKSKIKNQKSKMFVIALDIGGTAVKSALVSSLGRLYNEKRTSTKKIPTPKGVMKLVEELLKSHFDEARGRYDIVGIGIGSPGPLDPRRGIIHFTPNLPFKKPFHFVSEVKKILRRMGHANLPVLMQNDANLAALGEVWRGGARKSKVAVLLTLGTGVGGGVIIDGKIFDGTYGQGGELGHFPFDSFGVRGALLCGAQHPGCFEPYVNIKAMTRAARTLYPKEPDIDPLGLHKKAEKGEKKALKYFEEYGTMLGIGVAYLLNIFNPDVLLLGGAMSGSFRFFEKTLKQEASRRAFLSIFKQAKIKRAELGNKAGIFGVAKMVFDSL